MGEKNVSIGKDIINGEYLDNKQSYPINRTLQYYIPTYIGHLTFHLTYLAEVIVLHHSKTYEL